MLKALQDDEKSTWKSTETEQPSSPAAGDLEVLWVGGEGGIEVDLLSKEKITFTTIPAAGVHGVGLRALPGNLWQIFKGFIAARRIIKEFHPKVMFFTGGYLAVPVAFAGRTIFPRQSRPRISMYVPDIEPGLALRTLARLSDQIALTVEDSMNYFEFRSNLHVTGYPVRQNLQISNRMDARQKFNLSRDLPALLVFGGSRGARSINRALIRVLPDLLIDMQVIHISGHLDWQEVEAAKENLPLDLESRYHVYPYLYQDIGAALSIADLAVSRSGASVLGEFPLFGLPAILIPYPYAWRYQEVNARYLEKRGAAVVLQDGDLKLRLLTTIRDLMNDQSRRDRMGQSMLSLATPQAADSIADLIHGLVSMPSPGRI
ncbi:MAG: UDP-N-acetylglucosamine--N-acetylmuramyl-(pentapeptide) pyrophosphoryl-undecaprenol N-acetylglucosamine transferase [Chloroflexi bacterium]|nr:UDP-N-acetylglucosamine--N-acetylmuramyl-(pentapeptide) pyrophosphoryl-undecaprenol N-acetylglucosamine transferase [Chloroflexota bacterium]